MVSRVMPSVLSSWGRRAAAFVGNRDEQVLGADVVVLQPIRFRLCLIGDQLEPRTQAWLRAAVR